MPRDLTNVATALNLILDIFERHATDLQDGWLNENGTTKHNHYVPLLSILGHDALPSADAATVKTAITKMVDRGEIGKERLQEALVIWAKNYLNS